MSTLEIEIDEPRTVRKETIEVPYYARMDNSDDHWSYTKWIAISETGAVFTLTERSDWRGRTVECEFEPESTPGHRAYLVKDEQISREQFQAKVRQLMEECAPFRMLLTGETES